MKVSIITLPFHKPQIIKSVYDAMFAQTHQDLEIIAVIQDSADGSKEIIQKNYPQVKILEPGRNLFFAAGNNLGIHAASGEFIQLVNDDLILEPNYIEEMLKAFIDPHPSKTGEARPNEIGAAQVAAATGKILRYDFTNHQKTKIIDTVGITMSKSGRARDLGQNQVDEGQFDTSAVVFGVSGAAPMYRKTALERIKYQNEYLDEDFAMYWEDVDLSWRLNNAGFKNVYVPTAVAYHGRTAGQAKGGYLHVLKFIKHHSQLSKQVLKWNYKNHILMYLKNTKFIHPLFVLREFAMLAYIVVFETSTLKVIPELFRQLPKILKKRQWIYR